MLTATPLLLEPKMILCGGRLRLQYTFGGVSSVTASRDTLTIVNKLKRNGYET